MALDDLYQERILALAKAGAAARRLAEPDATATVDNPVCGDRVTIDVRLVDGRIAELGHRVRGCALCQASAGALEREAVGHDRREVAAAREEVKAFLANPEAAAPGWPSLAAFAPVRAFKSRHECVLLPFAALLAALDQKGG